MNRFGTFRRLAGLAGALLAFTAVSPAAFASRTPPFGGLIERAHVPAPVHTTVIGGMPGSADTDAPRDSGLIACKYPLSTQRVPAADYPKIRAQFAGSRWPDLRNAGTAYVDLAVALRTARDTDGYETVWFYQRLSAACAKHGQPPIPHRRRPS